MKIGMRVLPVLLRTMIHHVDIVMVHLQGHLRVLFRTTQDRPHLLRVTVNPNSGSTLGVVRSTFDILHCYVCVYILFLLILEGRFRGRFISFSSHIDVHIF